MQYNIQGGRGATGFDEEYYLETNRDVKEAIDAGIFRSGFDHFSRFGALELRSPNPIFNGRYYLKSNPDVVEAIASGQFGNAFEHYQKFGSAEGRKPSKKFVSGGDSDYEDYLLKNPDVAEAGYKTPSQAYRHYIEYGIVEGRSARTISGLELSAGIIQENFQSDTKPSSKTAIDIGDGGGGDGGGGGGGPMTYAYLDGDGDVFNFIDVDNDNTISDGDTFAYIGGGADWDPITGFNVATDEIDLPDANPRDFLGRYVDIGNDTVAYTAPIGRDFFYVTGIYVAGAPFTVDATAPDTLIFYSDSSPQVQAIILPGVTNLNPGVNIV